MVDAYINSLAQYCDSLFTGTELFFAANAQIEQAVLKHDDLEKPIATIKVSEQRFIEAQSHLSRVGLLYKQMDPASSVSFIDQMDNLDCTVKALRRAQLELTFAVDDGVGGTQYSLWKSGVTGSFVSTVGAIMTSVTWQSEFAVSHKLVVV
jgi:hypothetical protein